MTDNKNSVPTGPQVGLIMGSDSDWPTVEPAAEVLAEFGIPMEIGVVSAHRTPERMLDYAREAHKNGVKVIIACAGGSGLGLACAVLYRHFANHLCSLAA